MVSLRDKSKNETLKPYTQILNNNMCVTILICSHDLSGVEDGDVFVVIETSKQPQLHFKSLTYCQIRIFS